MARSDVGYAHRLSLSEALSISENRSSQGETTVGKRFWHLSKSLFAGTHRASRIWEPDNGSASLKGIYIRAKYTFITLGKPFFPVDASI
ncbi:hypothetical protein [Bradyrhizobium sp. NAS80.1]|uniref:hypothetical protein n=1 Tax=Bradyrhizobium sp. NAS80.1 TaxID=1680159 RepID=UPI0011614D66|nr:hypothetical protein [Bradyrhizobium sp. NAS80.1]